MLEIESSDLGNALIYNYDQNRFCWRCLRLYENNGQPPATQAFVMATV